MTRESAGTAFEERTRRKRREREQRTPKIKGCVPSRCQEENKRRQESWVWSI